MSEQKFYQMTDRVADLKEKFNNAKPALSAERAKLATEAIEKYPTDTPVLQKAHMFDYILRNMTVFIEDGELIVGNQGDTIRCAPVFPEFSSQWIIDEIDDFETRPSDPLTVSEKDRKLVLEYLPKWKGRSLDEVIADALPEDVKHYEEMDVLTVGNRDCGTGHCLPDYYNLLRRGLVYYKEKCQAKIAETVVDSPEKQRQMDFWNACIIEIDAAEAFAARYADLAEKKATKEQDAVRKSELLEIAEACRQVPMHPARTFQEAVQFVWFIHLMINIENNGHGNSFHRFDQYTYDFYKNDIAAGRVTDDKAIEIIECFFIKVSSIMKVRDKFYSQSFAGYPLWQNFIIGGQTEDGKDASNEVSMLCLKANQAVQMWMPTLSVRYHDNIDQNLVNEGLKMIQAGMATPAFFNDNLVIPMLQRKSGCTIEEARNWGIFGCVQPCVAGKSDGRPSVGYINTLKCFELVLNNGVNPVNGEQLGPKTGELETLDTLEKLENALFTQIDYFMDKMIEGFNIVGSIHATKCPAVINSIVTQDCIEKGKSVQEGGAKYSESGGFCVSIGNCTDAVAAVDTLINKEHLLDVPTLMSALKDNFEGKEDIRQMCLKKAPKYGNDIEYVDNIARDIVKHFGDRIFTFRDSRGGHYVEVVESQSMNVSQGKAILATPDGRFAHEPVNDNCSPAMGRYVSGPTACVNSVAHIDQKNTGDGCLFNLRFDPRSIQGENGIKVLDSVVKTFFRNMGEHIQINVIDNKTLRAAQEHPEEYRNLLVRVAGYLAYFTELDEEMQEAVIARTAHRPDGC